MESSFPPGALDDATLPAAEESLVRTAEGLRRGSTLGRYLVLERVGVGGMGEVYAAYDPELDRRVAIKLLHMQRGGTSSSSQGAPRLVREAQAMARLTHPNVITVHDVGTFEDQVFVAMEFVDGATLKEWAESRHPWAEVVDVFLAAGRGLAAAHDAGLIHRDFKPDNVLLGAGGRVLVADFGLARAAGEAPVADATPSEEDRSLSSTAPSLEGRLTATGAIMGTPAYMAPEQHLGGMVDERSDQFAFCVALYEALYQQRPFAGETLAARAFQVVQGKVREPPSGTRVPGRLRRIVLRGLSRDTAARYPSMHALLIELERGRDAARRRWMVGGALGVLALAAGVGLSTFAAAGPCPSAADRFDGLWDDARKSSAKAAFLATDLDFAAAAWRPVEAALDRYRDDWTSMHADACEATRLRGEQSEAMLDARMACLNGRLQHFESLVDLLEEPDAAVLVEAPEMAATLPTVAFCGDTAALAARVPPPEDPETRAAVSELRRELARAATRLEAGQLEAAAEIAEPLVTRAQALDYRPIEAEALSQRGAVRLALDQEEEGELDLSRAIAAALASGHSEFVARPATDLVHALSLRQGRFREADHFYLLANAALERMGGHPQLDTRLMIYRGDSLYRRGEYEPALEVVRPALQLLIDRLGPDHLGVVAGHLGMGTIMYGLGDYDEMEKHYLRALDIYERHYGPDSPKLSTPLNNLAVIHIVRSDYAKAIPVLERVIELRTKQMGPDHIKVIDARSNLGISLLKVNRNDEAEGHLRVVLDVYETRYGLENQDVGEAMINLSSAVYNMGKRDEARQLMERAVSVFEKTEAGSGIRLAQANAELGGIAHLDGDQDRAVKLGQRALEMAVATLGEDHPRTFSMRLELTHTLVAGGDAAAAIAVLEPRMSAFERDADQETLSRARFLLAQALAGDPAQHSRALALAEQALAGAEDPEADPEGSRVEIERWLASHR